jgi:ribosome recycling factor
MIIQEGFKMATYEEKMQKTIDSLNTDFAAIRAGRANPSMLDDVFVEAYGSKMPLKQVATIFVPEARQISIKPFDKTMLGSIEKAIYEANLGLAPNNNGESVFLTIPPLTEERRRQLNITEEGVVEVCEGARLISIDVVGNQSCQKAVSSTVYEEALNEEVKKPTFKAVFDALI